MKLSLCMIVKNEEDNLPRCLDSVKDIVDEIIIVDTGSEDSTIGIAKSYGAKVFGYTWNEDFSEARNISLKHACGDWILIMDADDEFEMADKGRLLSLLENDDVDAYLFETISYVGETPGHNAVINLNVRLIRNNMGYEFEGAIHEQITLNILNRNKDAKIATEKIRFYHYGYLHRYVVEKDKRGRNIKIIQKLLENESDNNFMLFNMGNEYFACMNYLKAFEYYQKAYESFNPNLAYSPKLLVRMTISLSELNRLSEELELIRKGLEVYPGFTDLEYLKGCLYQKENKYLLSIRSFRKCISMGEPPIELNFIMGVGSFKSYNALAEVYFELEDYNEAYNCCAEALKLKPNFMSPFYKVGQILFRLTDNIEAIKKKLEESFGENLNQNAYITLSDIFFGEGQYETSYEYILKSECFDGSNPKITYYKGVCLFFLKKFDDAFEQFKKIKGGEYYEKSVYNSFLCQVLLNNMEAADRILNLTRKFKSEDIRVVYKAFENIISGKRCRIISRDEKDSERYLNIIFDLMNTLLKISEFEIFEKSLQLFNLIDSNEALLRLAKLYYMNGHYNFAYQEFIRSIKNFDMIDIEGLDMMKKARIKLL